ncbi:MAG: hypothetical protein ACKPEO_05215 [Sphaerospermopsis kisseleviana]
MLSQFPQNLNASIVIVKYRCS